MPSLEQLKVYCLSLSDSSKTEEVVFRPCRRSRYVGLLMVVNPGAFNERCRFSFSSLRLRVVVVASRTLYKSDTLYKAPTILSSLYHGGSARSDIYCRMECMRNSARDPQQFPPKGAVLLRYVASPYMRELLQLS